MVSLDDAVLARYEHGGKRFEILIDPTLVDSFRNEPESVELDDILATEEVWLDARAGERPGAAAKRQPLPFRRHIPGGAGICVHAAGG